MQIVNWGVKFRVHVFERCGNALYFCCIVVYQGNTHGLQTKDWPSEFKVNGEPGQTFGVSCLLSSLFVGS